MTFSLGLIEFLILALTLQGLVLSAILFYSSKRISSNRWLAAFILLIAYCSLGTVIFNSSIPNTHPFIYVIMPQLRLALGPLLYFYTLSLLCGDNSVKGRHYLHFSILLFEMGPQMAFVFHMSGLLSIQGVSSWYLPFEKQVITFESGNLSGVPFFFSFIIYSALSYKLLYNSNPNQEVSEYKIKDIEWLNNLVHVIFCLVAIWAFTIILSFLPLPQLTGWIKYTMTVLAIAFAYWLGMTAYIRQSSMSEIDVLEYNKPRGKIYFSEVEAQMYRQRLIDVMETKLLYLNPTLKLDNLANELSVSEKSLSNLLNQHVGKNFNDFVNEYRVQEVKKKLADPAFSNFKIAAIAYDCGFNSLATFQRCFKQFSAITPSQYQNNLKLLNPKANSTQITI